MKCPKEYWMFLLISCMIVIHVKSACTNDTCLNGGNCKVNECFCLIGWSGETCSTDTDSMPKPAYYFSSYNLANGGIISCAVGENCSFPIYTKFTNGQGTPFIVGPTSGDVSVVIGNSVQDEHKGLVTRVIVKAQTPGKETACFTHGSVHSVCYEIEFSEFTHRSSLPFPSYPEGTTIPCRSHMCHIYIYTEKSSSLNCDFNILLPGNGTVTVVNFKSKETNNNQCVSDTAFLATDGDLCIKKVVRVDNKIYCYKVQDKSNVPDPCTSKSCSEGGACFVNGTEAACMCLISNQGTDCDREERTSTELKKSDATVIIVAAAVGVPLVIAAGVAVACCIRKYLTKRSLEDQMKTSTARDKEEGQESGEKHKLKETERKLGLRNKTHPEL